MRDRALPFMAKGASLSLALTTVCAALLASGCSTEKSRNPTSPTVAGPIAGVTITSPTPLEPKDGKELTAGQAVDLTVENASTTGERTIWHQIEVSLDADFSSKVYTVDNVGLGPNGRSTYRVPTNLTGGRTYFWRARAKDGANTGPFSGGAFFKVIVPVLIEAPIPTSPVGDAVLSTARPTLVMRNTAISGPTGTVFYRFDVATDAAFANTLYSAQIARSGGDSTSWQVPVDLPLNTRIFWRGIGYNEAVVSGMSPTVSFRTPAPAPAPTPTPTPTPTPNPSPNPSPNPEPSPTPGATREIGIDEAAAIIRAVHDGLGYNLGSGSSREQRVEFLWTAVAVVSYGHARFNPRGGDPGWCVKDAGGGRPPSDDVLVRCGSRDAWDLIGGAGANGYSFHQDYLGKLSGEQNVYPAPRSSLPR